eukprot:jgi/Mesvir1/2901/Mv13973-RA.2
MHTHTYTCTHIHTHAHTYTHIHTHTYTYTHAALLGSPSSPCRPATIPPPPPHKHLFLLCQLRIKDWDTLEKTPGMMREYERKRQEDAKEDAVASLFANAMYMANGEKDKGKGEAKGGRTKDLADLAVRMSSLENIRKMRERELQEEREAADTPRRKSSRNPRDYIDGWSYVIMDHPNERVPGAMLPLAFWYNEFMPKLLKACSVGAKEAYMEGDDEPSLDKWHEEARTRGEFSKYGQDVVGGWSGLSLPQKVSIRQAWRLTSSYLNGLQKRRERHEEGGGHRETGALSQYVAFIDAFLGRSDVADQAMRVSFPYYLGNCVWRFLHTAAEIVCSRPAQEQPALASAFGDFFRLFRTMYPCPYCRYHLNYFVVANREANLYPLEYLLLGWQRKDNITAVSLEEKLQVVQDGPSMRLFLWKLHNTVNSSIGRAEPWYHRDESAPYTSRFWPSLDSELSRAANLGETSLSTARVFWMYSMLRPTLKLASLRADLLAKEQAGDIESLLRIVAVSDSYIEQLDEMVLHGQFLQNTYRYDPDMVAEIPLFTSDEESYARDGYYTE